MFYLYPHWTNGAFAAANVAWQLVAMATRRPSDNVRIPRARALADRPPGNHIHLLAMRTSIVTTDGDASFTGPSTGTGLFSPGENRHVTGCGYYSSLFPAR